MAQARPEPNDGLDRLRRSELLSRLRRLRRAKTLDDALQLQLQLQLQQRLDQLAETQRLLEHSRDRYADLYESAPLPFVTLDRYGVIVDVNMTGAAFFQRERRWLLGKPFLVLLSQRSRRLFLDHLRRCRSGLPPVPIGLELATPHGVVPVDVYTRRVDDPSSDVIFRIAIVDVSAEHEADEIRARAHAEQIEFARNEERLRAADRAKDQFLAVLSHELRTPLAPALTGLAVLQRRTDVPVDLQPIIDMMRRNLELEARLVDDLLDVTRIVHGKLKLRVERVDVHEAIHQALETCAPTRAGVDVKVDLRAARHHVDGDPARLRQVFWNLFRNALQHTPPGGHVRVSTRNEQGGRLRVVVEDTGEGIAHDDLERIFSPFQQGGQERRPGTGIGLGLGLAICRSIVEAHGGRIAVASDGPGRGARFDVALDASQDGDAAAPAREAAPAPDARGVTILLVEDHLDSAQALAEALGLEGYRVTVARTLAAGRERLADNPDVVISDVGLPDGSGLDLLRDAGRPAARRAIALSGFGSERDVRSAHDAGFDAHLTKPVELEVLLDTIRALVNGSRPNGAVPARL